MHVTRKFVTLLVVIFALFSYAHAAKINGLGNDYEVYDFGTYTDNLPWYQGTYSDPNNNNWYVPAHNYKHPVYLYQLNPNLVQTQMRDMRSSGIDVLVLHISFAELATCESNGGCYTPYNDGIWGYLTDDSQASLRSQQQTNLTDLLKYASQIGFRKVFLRFGFAEINNKQYFNYPSPGWNETEYQKAWNLIYNTRNLATRVLANTATRLVIDLGGEQIGVTCPANDIYCANQQSTYYYNKQYVQRLWSDYTYNFGTSDTIGFSFIGCSSTVQIGLPWYGTLKPNEYAFDVYGGCTNNHTSSAGADLLAAWAALGTEKSKPVMVMETYNNDATNASSISSTLAANPGLVLTDLVQWPLTRSPSCTGCNDDIQNGPIAALSTTAQATNYLPIAASAAVDNLNTVLLNVDGSSCVPSSPSTCVKFNIGYAPSGVNTVWQVWVTANNGTRTLWGCNAGTQTGTTAAWITKGNSYRFDYYKTSSCTVVPAQGTASATSYVTLR